MITVRRKEFRSCLLSLSWAFLLNPSLFGLSTPGQASTYPELDGFPVLLEDGIAGKSSVNVGDIEGDGDLEICFGTSDGKVYMLHHTGEMAEGWPISPEGAWWVQATPSLVDIEGDGDLEVIVTNGTYLHAWHHDGTPVEGFPVLLTYSVASDATPAIGDLDGDGDFEIVHGSYEYPCLLFAWHHDGTPVEGWPVVIFPGYMNRCGTGSYAPALADLDGDGDLEAVFPTWGGQVYVLNHDGTDYPGWPIDLVDDPAPSSPVIGDIDGDGEVEIVVGTWNAKVYAWDTGGEVKPGWPWEDGSGLPAGIVLADLVGDDALEVVVNYMLPVYWNIHVIDGVTGIEVPGWPQPEEGEDARGGQSVVISDIDDDSEKELVVAAHDGCPGFVCSGYILAYNPDGTEVAGFPISLGIEVPRTAPCIADLDQDGDLEICVVTDWGHFYWGDCYIHVWDLPFSYRGDRGDWRYIYHDPFHTNDFGYILPTEGPIDVDLKPDTITVRGGDSFEIIASFTNLNVVYQSFYTGLFLRLPNGEPFGANPLYGPYSLRLPLLWGFSIEQQLTIPKNVPTGGYRLLLPAASSIHNIMDMDSTIVNVVE